MKTLSIRQPWADLIMRGIKDIENRSWTTTHRGPLLIHASKTLMQEPANERFYGPDHEWERGGIVGIVDLVDVVTDSESPWAHKDGETYHWVLANPRRVSFVPVNGKLNLYETPWPSTLPVGRVHRRDEQPATPEMRALANTRVSAAAVVARSLSKKRFFEVAHALLEDLSPDHEQAIVEFGEELAGSITNVLDLLTLDEANALLTAAGHEAQDDVEDAIGELEDAITTEADSADEYIDLDEEGEDEDEADDEDENEDDEAEAVEDDEAPPPGATPRTAPIDIVAVDVDVVMAAFRQAARGQGSMKRVDLIRAVSRALGYGRLGSTIEEVLRGHLRAAVRRRIIEADGEQVRAATSIIDDYSMEELRDALVMGLRRGQRIERDEAIRQTVQGLGFRRVTDNVRQAFKSVFNSAIRQGLLESEAHEVVVRC